MLMLIADLHIHSKYSRATSPDMNIDELEKFAKLKGIGLLGTGDFTHPTWLAELKEKLKPVGGFLQSEKAQLNWLLTAEISNIYSEGGRVRKIHHVLVAPSFEVVDQINEFLGKLGNLKADGRPIFGKMNSAELVERIMSISKDCLVIPAHIWTPWFSLFGSMSGFDRIKDCYQDQLKHIHALETGLSSDPAMNWRLSQLDPFTLVSNSDCHSAYPWRLGREANVMDVSNYSEFVKAIVGRDPKKFLFTIEVDPNYGKYHYDGHRNCNVRLSPDETKKVGGICPVCKSHLTIGVLNRVEELADRPEGFRPEGAVPFKSLIPLSELIAIVLGKGVATKQVWAEFYKLISKFGSEYSLMLNASIEELQSITLPKLAEVIILNREGKIKILPGYDGVYGQPQIEGTSGIIQDNEEAEEKDKPRSVPPAKINPRAMSFQRSITDF